MFKLYPGMAFTNIKTGRKTYIPYMISCTLTTAMFYIVCSLADNENLGKLWGGNIIQSYMNIGQFIIAIFALIFLFYINSFLVKRRKSEFGLYNILGMEKRHICKIIFFETLYVFLITAGAGLIIGVLLDKLLYMILLKIMVDYYIPMGFYISVSGIFKALSLFGAIFLLILANSIRAIYKSKPIDLMKSDSAGEREPKARWIFALLGCICLAAGYFIAVTTENPVAAFTLFFVAVILVIIGTYLLFTAGSITLLKLLRKNKGYYYKTNHFISVSSMMYRMKRNAVGLANICILSTMVLVMISATLSMYLGTDDAVEKRYPSEFSITAVADDTMTEEAIKITKKAIRSEGLEPVNEICYDNLGISAVYDEKKHFFETNPDKYEGLSVIKAYNSLNSLIFVSLSDYNKAMKTHESLDGNEVLVYSNRENLPDDFIKIYDCKFHVKKSIDSFMANGNAVATMTSTHFIVVKDKEILYNLFKKQTEAYENSGTYIQTYFTVDVKGNRENNEDAIKAAYESAGDSIDNASGFNDFTGYLKCRTIEEESYGLDFTGLYFIGIFLGILFIMATVLIMYYKQITEGFEDKSRFEIMQNVGMSHREVKKSINSQILTVFFLPLVTAGMHIAFAFPFIFKIMALMGLLNMHLYALCTIGVFLAFALFYTVVYMLTAKLYYGIVKK